MKELFSARSTNGRWGLAVVGPDDATLPAQGSINHIGRVAGVDTYVFTPGETKTWVLTSGEVTAHGGATVVAMLDLQSSDWASIVLLGPEAVVESHGYKRRSSSFSAFLNGEKVDIPAPVLLAMGLIAPRAEVAEVPPPPALEGAMASAFMALRRPA